MMPNHALQRTAASCCGCPRRASSTLRTMLRRTDGLGLGSTALLMRSPLKIAAVVTVALFWSKIFLFAAEAPTDPLWRKAVAVAAANVDWVPGLVITRSEVLHKGEVV